MRPRTELTRRDALRLAGVATAGAALSACTTASNEPRPTTSSPGGPEDPDRALRSEVAASERQLLDLYAEAAPGLPAALATRVRTLGARHQSYRAAVDPAGASASPSGSPSGSATSSTASRTADVAFTLRRLRTAESTAAAARAAQSVRASDPELARIIVLAGAGAAGAAEVLRLVRA